VDSPGDPTVLPAAERLEAAAAALLEVAQARVQSLHLPGVRARYRAELERTIELAESALALVERESAGPHAPTGVRRTLLAAHAARANDARHGAGQLSLGSQRAPTVEDCDDGWRRVEAIVRTCEASALETERMASVLDDPAAWESARATRAVAQDARRLIDERNHAYTFHADPGFSFGEGWYLAAAAVLAGAVIQIEPGKPQTTQAERFLRDAGLGSQLRPYRSRPRANKALPDIVARAFRADAHSAQTRLRAAFLGALEIPPAIADFADRACDPASAAKKVLLWVRYGAHQKERNTSYAELVALAQRALALQLVPVLIGDGLRGEVVPPGALDLTLFWRQPVFQGADMRRAQLLLFEHLRQKQGLVGQLGVTTAGMDGPALLGLRTMYLTAEPNVRLGRWVGAVPGYEEIVRRDGYLERISRTLASWAAG
jgi:hypothetical protein